jgi:hypothetical protein
LGTAVVAAVAVVGVGGLSNADAQPVQGPSAAGTSMVVKEREAATAAGRNDTPATAQAVTGFGTKAGKAGTARISGTLAAPKPTIVLPVGVEDNGSRTTAVDTRLTPGRVVRASGTIGDGPHGTAGDSTGDFDFYVIRGATGGQLLNVFVDTPGSDLQPALQYWNEGNTEGVASPDKGSNLLTTPIETDGDAYISIGGAGSRQANPGDSGSGDGASSEGTYTVTFALEAGDTDMYAVDLAAGDVFSAAVSGGAAQLQVFDTARKLAIGSTGTRLASLLPKASPLARGGNASLHHIAARPGRYFLAVSGGQGGYDVTTRVNRPGPEAKKAAQTIFIDLDGASVDPSVFDPEVTGVRTASPLSAFTSKWGITTAAGRNKLTDQIIATVTENLQGDFAGTGSKVKILNSRDHQDPFGKPNVSRIVIGGTEEELGVSGFLSQSVDPGNFATEETALVAPGRLADPSAGEFSLNTYLKTTSDREKFVGTAIGNIASHEAGHYLGLTHAGTFNATPNVMLHGIEGPIFGVGPDNVGGTADDVDLDYAAVPYGSDTGFTGIQDCPTRIRWALS